MAAANAGALPGAASGAARSRWLLSASGDKAKAAGEIAMADSASTPAREMCFNSSRIVVSLQIKKRARRPRQGRRASCKPICVTSALRQINGARSASAYAGVGDLAHRRAQRHVALIGVLAEMDRAVLLRPGGQIRDVHRDRLLEVDAGVLARLDHLHDLVLGPLAIVLIFEQENGELHRVLDAHAAMAEVAVFEIEDRAD